MQVRDFFARKEVADCELNPIELVWAEVLGRVARQNVSFRLKDVQGLVHQSLAAVEPQSWAKSGGTRRRKWTLFKSWLSSSSLFRLMVLAMIVIQAMMNTQRVGVTAVMVFV